MGLTRERCFGFSHLYFGCFVHDRKYYTHSGQRNVCSVFACFFSLFLQSFYCELCVCKLTHDVVSYFRVRECHFSFSEPFCQQWMFLSKDAANSNIFPPACTLCLVCFYWSSQAVLLFCHISKCDGRLGKSGLGCCFWNTWAAKLGCITFYTTLSLCSKLRMWRWCGLWARNCSLLLITHRRTSAITSGWRWEILSFNQTVIFQTYLPLNEHCFALCPEEFKCY